MCIRDRQGTADGASSAEKCKWKPIQKLEAEHSMSRVAERAAKIRQLHERNSLYYLTYKSEVAAAGQTLFVLFILVTFWLIKTWYSLHSRTA